MSAWPTPSQPSAASLGLSWIESVTESLPGPDTCLLMKSLVVTALCGDIEPSLLGQVMRVIKKIRVRLKENIEREIGRCDGVTVLLCCVIEQNLTREPMPAFARYARQAASALKELPPTEAQEGYHAARVLLSRLGLFKKPEPSYSAFAPDLGALISAEQEAISKVLEQVEYLSYYGQYHVEASTGLTPVLESIMMSELRCYKLATASRLLRALAYLGAGDSLAMRTGRHFLLINQTAAGSFGFFDGEIERLRSEVPDPIAPLKLQLIVSLACLWALAETGSRGYRLFRDIAASGT